MYFLISKLLKEIFLLDNNLFQDTFKDLDLQFQLDCGSISGLAQTMDELAEVVESVGVEKLSKELGVDLDFISKF